MGQQLIVLIYRGDTVVLTESSLMSWHGVGLVDQTGLMLNQWFTSMISVQLSSIYTS